jgi:type IV pilus assembly protein PilV
MMLGNYFSRQLAAESREQARSHRQSHRGKPLAADRRVRFARGFSLVEALVALVVLSVGLLGIAALYVSALRFGRTALLRSDAVTLAGDMVDRIRANSSGGSSYALAAGAANTAVAACSTGGCTAAQMATTDKAQWTALLARSLPAGTGTVAVDATTSPATYTITVRWTEPNVGAQTYVLGFQ